MEDLIILAQVIVAFSVYYVWIFRFHNVLKEFKSFELSDLTRNFVGASKISLSTLLLAGIWFPTLVFIPALLMGGFMISAQFFHFKIKNTFIKHLPSLVLLLLSLTIAYFSMP
ncbi:MAG: DoxX family protein [Parvicellaceae bacterium]|tara:strand:- start:801 stop:1139 length:339 start_codon:yes stop_codon:yes gene_type:complete